ncbi:hypothetical protein CHS0354_017554, partial [Potamilus streckersoni]
MDPALFDPSSKPDVETPTPQFVNEKLLKCMREEIAIANKDLNYILDSISSKEDPDLCEEDRWWSRAFHQRL